MDTALQTGMTVSPYYDSLVAKLIAFGGNFEEARKRALVALDEFVVSGVETTLPFHRELVRNEQFSRGELSTTFIESTGMLKHISRSAESALDEHYFMIASLLLSRNQFGKTSEQKNSPRERAAQKRTEEKRKGRFIDAI